MCFNTCILVYARLWGSEASSQRKIHSVVGEYEKMSSWRSFKLSFTRKFNSYIDRHIHIYIHIET